MSNYLVVDFDDFGIDHVISDQCQSRDCRKELLELKAVNPAFKVTLFTIPYYTTLGIIEWALENQSWVELGVHGWAHTSNYECEDWSMLKCEETMAVCSILGFKKLFKAPGWQISDGCYQALDRNGWAVADQAYNDDRRPKDLPVYKVGDNSIHGHTWNCVGNGIEETLEQLKEQIKGVEEFKFVTEVCQ